MRTWAVVLLGLAVAGCEAQREAATDTDAAADAAAELDADGAAAVDTSDHAARAAAGAQDPGAEPKPAGWRVRLDRPEQRSAEDVYFVDMAPGWHVTTGPAAILYHPDSAASGEYALEAEMHLFDPGERREGYGVFFGGQELEGDNQRYTYFLLRRDGRFLVKTRTGSETTVVRDWTDAPAIVGWDEREGDAESVANTLGVDIGADAVGFSVNGTEVASVPRAELGRLDGVFGMRVNHALNLHVTRLETTE